MRKPLISLLCAIAALVCLLGSGGKKSEPLYWVGVLNGSMSWYLFIECVEEDWEIR